MRAGILPHERRAAERRDRHIRVSWEVDALHRLYAAALAAGATIKANGGGLTFAGETVELQVWAARVAHHAVLDCRSMLK